MEKDKFKIGDYVWTNAMERQDGFPARWFPEVRCGIIRLIDDWHEIHGYLVYFFDEKLGSRYYEEKELSLMTKDEVVFENL